MLCLNSLPTPNHKTGESIRTQRTAKNTSVTLNLLSTLHGVPAAESSPVARSSSPRKVNAQRRPHHAAGAVLRARQKRSGKCQRLSTPSRTATRGWRRELFSRVEGGDWRAAWRLVVEGETLRVGDLGDARGGDCEPAWGWEARGRKSYGMCCRIAIRKILEEKTRSAKNSNIQGKGRERGPLGEGKPAPVMLQYLSASAVVICSSGGH